MDECVFGHVCLYCTEARISLVSVKKKVRARNDFLDEGHYSKLERINNQKARLFSPQTYNENGAENIARERKGVKKATSTK